MSFRTGQIDRLVAFGGIHGWGGFGGDAEGFGGYDAAGYGGGSGSAGGSASESGGYDADSAAGAFGVGAAAAERDAANNANQSSVGVGYEGGYFSEGINAGDQNSQRDKETGKVESSFTQNKETNLDTMSRREAEAYAPSSRSDRHGTHATSQSGNSGLLGSVRDGVVDAAKDESKAGLIGAVTSAVLGPAAGFVAKSGIEGVAAANMKADVMGQPASYGQAVVDAAFSNAVDAVKGKAGGTVGSKVGGAVAGVPGAVVGGLLGSAGAKSIGGSSTGSPGSADGSAGQGFEGFSGNSEPQSVASTNTSTESTNSSPGVETGWDSSFGSYDSHVAGFKSYGADTAQQAFS